MGSPWNHPLIIGRSYPPHLSKAGWAFFEPGYSTGVVEESYTLSKWWFQIFLEFSHLFGVS